MLFPTVEFAVFFTIVFVASWLLRPRPRWWRLFLLAASYVFYGWWDWSYLLLLGGVTIGTQLAVEGVARSRARPLKLAWLVLGVAGNVAALGWFKYYSFVVDTTVGIFDRVGIDAVPPLVRVVLPVGISFYVFQAISYVIDTYREDQRPLPLLDAALYLAFFPQLVAGPILRTSELVPQFHRKVDPRHIEGARGFRLIVAGMFKKVVISSYLAAEIVDPVFAAPGNHSSFENLFAVYGYAIQIYADFSGYTDIAIGVALLLGFRFPQNFDSPYIALSIQDFWRRWHMTLSRWLRDYVYVSLGGNRKGRFATYRNLMLTMLIGGLWHGASWTFVVWGGIHGTALVIERLRTDARARGGLPPPAQTPGWQVVRWLVTFNVVCLAWIFFRAQTFADAWAMLTGLVTDWGPAPLVTPLLVLTIAGMIAAQFVPERVPERLQLVFSRAPLAVQGVTLALCFFLIDALGPAGVAPFIYFQF